MQLDKFDLAILAILQQDSRASLQEISARVGLTSTPCWTRIKKMESAGVIQGYTVRLDPSAVGFSESVIVQVTLESHNDETLDEFGKALEEIPEVLEAYLVSGDYDYYIRIAVRDTRDYERLLRERLYRIPGIRHSKSSFVLRRLKESLLPLAAAAVIPGADRNVTRASTVRAGAEAAKTSGAKRPSVPRRR
jgi:Lrp/AsnC family leucine-responsive transcriptional regulator